MKRERDCNLKQVEKIGSQVKATMFSSNGDNESDLRYVREVTSFSFIPSDAELSAPPLFDGAFVPLERFEDFSAAVNLLAEKHHVVLPIYARPMDGIVNTRPTLQLRKVGDKQKIFKLLDDYAALVVAHAGYFIGEGGEGRLKSVVAHKQLDDDVAELFAKVKTVFDPYGILNPGVKQPGDLKQLVAQLRSSYDTANFADSVPNH